MTKKKEKPNENVRTVSVVIPPDGGWGWVVMIASFSCNTIVDGIVFNSGFIQSAVETDFQLTKAQVRKCFLCLRLQKYFKNKYHNRYRLKTSSTY